MFYKSKLQITAIEPMYKKLKFNGKPRAKYQQQRRRFSRAPEQTIVHAVDAAIRRNAAGRTPNDSKHAWHHDHNQPDLDRHSWPNGTNHRWRGNGDGRRGVTSMGTTTSNHIWLPSTQRHACTVERFNGLHRLQQHKLEGQLTREGLTIQFGQILDSCTFCVNVLTHVGKAIPHQAVYGRNMLCQSHITGGHMEEAQVIQSRSGLDRSTLIRHQCRFRGICAMAIVEAIAQPRIERALDATTRVPGQVCESTRSGVWIRDGRSSQILHWPKCNDI